MASEYVSRVMLEVNGQDIDDFNAVEEGEVELGRQVKLMNQSGFCNVCPRYSVTVDYVIPSDGPIFNFAGVSNGTLTIDYLSGVRVTYVGVSTGKIGKAKFDGEKETVRTIELFATGRSQETANA